MDGIRRCTALTLVLLCAAIAIPGCVGLPAQLLYVLYGNKAAAEFEGLNSKSIAVVCVTDASSYGPNTVTFAVERQVAALLAKHVPNARVIPQSKVDNWKDQYGWDESDFMQIGRGVGADMVVAIEISSYSLHEGSTMYKGKVTATTDVFDTKDQSVAFHAGPEDYEFPKSGRPAMQLSEREFEAQFLAKFCEHLARRFYEYEKIDGIAEDAGM